MNPPSRSPLGADFLAAPDTVLAELRERCPVVRTTTPAGRPVWVVTREADVRAGFLDPRLSLDSRPPKPDRPHRALDLTLVNYDPPEHTRIRRLATAAFAASRIAAHQERIAELAEARLDALTEGRPVDLMAEFAAPFAFEALCTVFGIPGPEIPRLSRTLIDLTNRHDLERVVTDLDAVVRTLIAAAHARLDAEPATATATDPDVHTAVVRAWRESGRVSEDELVDLIAMLITAGFDSTVQALGLAVLALARHPELLARLHAEPALLPGAVDELLRWDTPGPFGTPRIARDDLEIGGTVIPAGSTVLLSVLAANRDPRRFAEPDRLDLDRPGSGRHLTFGLGPHYCPGAPLARAELTAALGGLVRRWPGLHLAVPVDELRWLGGHHHRRLGALPVRLRPS
ncbi:cytochrome P450 [Kitasatospora sp. HPMI-4]|uniref:cytochrome P450 n=1 Tax=Kitasatospora sp. HPMI-4 TaxID=3448443 RepID=UPI003F1B4D35